MSVHHSQGAVRTSETTAAVHYGGVLELERKACDASAARASDRPRAFDTALLLASHSQVLASLHAAAAHDFRNSLNAMALSVELLGRGVDAGGDGERGKPDRHRLVESLRQELNVMSQSVADALEESRLDQAHARCRLGGLLESVVSLLRVKAERQGVVVTTEVADTTIDVFGRPGELKLALLNLAANALDAMPRGGRLTFGLSSDGSAAVLTVSDSGPGIPDDDRDRIWDLFFSTKQNGLGLGLYVVRSVVEAHGGSATVEAAQPGTRFAIRLPIRSEMSCTR
jgi:signal transduction histidine kinase